MTTFTLSLTEVELRFLNAVMEEWNISSSYRNKIQAPPDSFVMGKMYDAISKLSRQYVIVRAGSYWNAAVRTWCDLKENATKYNTMEEALNVVLPISYYGPGSPAIQVVQL